MDTVGSHWPLLTIICAIGCQWLPSPPLITTSHHLLLLVTIGHHLDHWPLTVVNGPLGSDADTQCSSTTGDMTYAFTILQYSSCLALCKVETVKTQKSRLPSHVYFINVSGGDVGLVRCDDHLSSGKVLSKCLDAGFPVSACLVDGVARCED